MTSFTLGGCVASICVCMSNALFFGAFYVLAHCVRYWIEMLVIKSVEDELFLGVGLINPNKCLVNICRAACIICLPIMEPVYMLTYCKCFVGIRPFLDFAFLSISRAIAVLYVEIFIYKVTNLSDCSE